MHEIFKKYIPQFEYELVSLRDYSFADLATFGNVLSLFMMIDKVRTAEDLSELGKLPKDYAERLKNMNVPAHLKELLVKVATVLLHKIDVPQDDINTFVSGIDERGVSEVTLLQNYSVQETRRQARAEAEAELRVVINALLNRGSTVAEVASIMNKSESDILTMLKEQA